MQLSLAPLTALILALAFAGCDRPAETPIEAEEHDETAALATPTEPAGQGEGTLRIGADTYQFDVRVCDLSGEADDVYQTLVGRGTTAQGERFDVFVSRNDIGHALAHTVSFQVGDVRAPDAVVLEAQRLRMNGRWSDPYGGPAEPLIEIDGDRVTATGMFVDANDALAAEPVEGHLEAVCR